MCCPITLSFINHTEPISSTMQINEAPLYQSIIIKNSKTTSQQKSWCRRLNQCVGSFIFHLDPCGNALNKKNDAHRPSSPAVEDYLNFSSRSCTSKQQCTATGAPGSSTSMPIGRPTDPRREGGNLRQDPMAAATGGERHPPPKPRAAAAAVGAARRPVVARRRGRGRRRAARRPQVASRRRRRWRKCAARRRGRSTPPLGRPCLEATSRHRHHRDPDRRRNVGSSHGTSGSSLWLAGFGAR
jgi:hypothetical protein